MAQVKKCVPSFQCFKISGYVSCLLKETNQNVSLILWIVLSDQIIFIEVKNDSFLEKH